MLMEVKNNFRYIKNAIVCNIKSTMEYKVSFIMQSVFMFINNFFFLIFWVVVLNVLNNQSSGIGMKEILYVWSISTIAFGFSHFIFGGIENISKNLINGGMDSYITQPKNIFINIATSKCDFSAFGDLMYGLVIAIFASNNIWQYLVILGYGILGSIVVIAIMTIIRSLVGFIGDVEDIAERYEHVLLINFCVYPEKIFGNIVKFMLYTVVPAGYIVHLPIKLIGKFDLKVFIMLLLIIFIYCIIAKIMFNKALDNYESGNVMTLKG